MFPLLKFEGGSNAPQYMPLDSNPKTTRVQSFIHRLPKSVKGAQCLGGEHSQNWNVNVVQVVMTLVIESLVEFQHSFMVREYKFIEIIFF